MIISRLTDSQKVCQPTCSPFDYCTPVTEGYSCLSRRSWTTRIWHVRLLVELFAGVILKISGKNRNISSAKSFKESEADGTIHLEDSRSLDIIEFKRFVWNPSLVGKCIIFQLRPRSVQVSISRQSGLVAARFARGKRVACRAIVSVRFC